MINSSSKIKKCISLILKLQKNIFFFLLILSLIFGHFSAGGSRAIYIYTRSPHLKKNFKGPLKKSFKSFPSLNKLSKTADSLKRSVMYRAENVLLRSAR